MPRNNWVIFESIVNQGWVRFQLKMVPIMLSVQFYSSHCTWVLHGRHWHHQYFCKAKKKLRVFIFENTSTCWWDVIYWAICVAFNSMKNRGFQITSMILGVLGGWMQTLSFLRMVKSEIADEATTFERLQYHYREVSYRMWHNINREKRPHGAISLDIHTRNWEV